jgi:hypothetical protein
MRLPPHAQTQTPPSHAVISRRFVWIVTILIATAEIDTIGVVIGVMWNRPSAYMRL